MCNKQDASKTVCCLRLRELGGQTDQSRCCESHAECARTRTLRECVWKPIGELCGTLHWRVVREIIRSPDTVCVVHIADRLCIALASSRGNSLQMKMAFAPKWRLTGDHYSNLDGYLADGIQRIAYGVSSS